MTTGLCAEAYYLEKSESSFYCVDRSSDPLCSVCVPFTAFTNPSRSHADQSFGSCSLSVCLSVSLSGQEPVKFGPDPNPANLGLNSYPVILGPDPNPVNLGPYPVNFGPISNPLNI